MSNLNASQKRCIHEEDNMRYMCMLPVCKFCFCSALLTDLNAVFTVLTKTFPKACVHTSMCYPLIFYYLWMNSRIKFS